MPHPLGAAAAVGSRFRHEEHSLPKGTSAVHRAGAISSAACVRDEGPITIRDAGQE